VLTFAAAKFDRRDKKAMRGISLPFASHLIDPRIACRNVNEGRAQAQFACGYTVHQYNALYGNAGIASSLVAGSGADTLIVTGNAGTTMTGGAGSDTFAFPNVMGHDTVTNFGTTKDVLQFNATLFANFAAAMADASQVGANTVFTIDTEDTVTLDNVTKTSLATSNFHFV
jgi:Ca2+-binding RTX toxin-like protein